MHNDIHSLKVWGSWLSNTHVTCLFIWIPVPRHLYGCRWKSILITPLKWYRLSAVWAFILHLLLLFPLTYLRWRLILVGVILRLSANFFGHNTTEKQENVYFFNQISGCLFIIEVVPLEQASSQETKQLL